MNEHDQSTKFQRETAERICPQHSGGDGDICICRYLVEAMQAQEAEDFRAHVGPAYDYGRGNLDEIGRRLEEAERQRDEADRAFRAHDVLVVGLQVRAEKAERQRDEALALLRELQWVEVADDSCPVCLFAHERGCHSDDCSLAALLTPAENVSAGGVKDSTDDTGGET